METQDSPGRLHLFFDTTEVTDDAKSRSVGRIGSAKLRDLSGQLGATLYVPDLVLDEAAFLRLRHLEGQIKKVKDSSKELEGYVAIHMEQEPDSRNLVGILREEIEDQLSTVPVTVIPTASVTLAEVLEMSKWRVPPFNKPDDPTGFHDAVILLASIKYAHAERLQDCIFVSSDKDFIESAVKKLGIGYGVPTRLVKGTERIIETMENLHTAHLKSLADLIVQRVTKFMNDHRSIVQTFLDEHPLKLGDFGFLYDPFPAEVVSVVVGEIEAFPEGSPGETGEYPIKLSANAVGEFLVSKVVFEAPEYAELEARPGALTEATGVENPLGLLLGLPSMGVTFPRPRIIRSPVRVEVRLKGKAKGFLREGEFVGPPEITSLEPSRLTLR